MLQLTPVDIANFNLAIETWNDDDSELATNVKGTRESLHWLFELKKCSLNGGLVHLYPVSGVHIKNPLLVLTAPVSRLYDTPLWAAHSGELPVSWTAVYVNITRTSYVSLHDLTLNITEI